MKLRKIMNVVAVLCIFSMVLGSCSGVRTPSDTTNDSEKYTDGITSNGANTGMESMNIDTTEAVSVEIEIPKDNTNLPSLSFTEVTGISTKLGGESLPKMESTASEGAPQISEISDMTYPDETLAISGDNLKGASVLIWSEGSLKAVMPLRSDNTKMEITIPKSMKKSATIIWPYNDSGIGNPVIINKPEIYWADILDIKACVSGQEICFFGSGMYIDGYQPVVIAKYSNGETENLEITDFNPYRINAKISTKLAVDSSAEFYIHNGTGGKYGWSNSVKLTAVEDNVLPLSKLNSFNVDAFGAVPNDGKDDLSAISDAIRAAAKEGGGVILFGDGEYNLSSTLTISNSFPKGLYLVGVGMGKYDMKSSLDHSEYDYEGLSDKYTLIKFADPATTSNMLLQIGANNVFVSDMTIIGGDNGDSHNYNIFVSGDRISFEKVRFIKQDLRDYAKDGSDLSVGSNIEIDNYSKNISIIDCELHQKGSAISVGNIEGIWPWGFFDSARTVRNTKIINNKIYGYAGPYTSPSGKMAGDLGEISRGLTGFNLQGLVFEGNTIQGYDRDNCKLLVRSIYVNATCEMMYIANNTMKNVGNTPDSGFDLNTGEQILIHGNDFTGGIFNVLTDEGEKVTVRTDNINNKNASPYSASDNTGSRLFKGLDKGTRGYLYVYGGKGIGQSRSIVGYKEKSGIITFTLDEPFTIPLDETSIVDLISYSSHNIIYKNTIANDKLILHRGLKTGGVLLFFQGGYNVIAENEFKNLTFGVAINARFKGPCIWNTVRDNKFTGFSELEKDAAQGGDSTYNATFFCVSVVKCSPEGWDNYNVWYAVGNVFRNNVCEDGDYAAELTTNRWNRSPSEWMKYYGEEKGAAMSIIENNVFKNVKTGVLVGNPDYWSILRNNKFTFANKAGYKKMACIFEQKQSNYYFVMIENNAVKYDANNTVNEGFGQSTDVN